MPHDLPRTTAEKSTLVAPLAYRVRGNGDRPGIHEMTGWSPAFIYRLIETGQLPAVRVGRSVTVRHDDLMSFLDEHRDGAA